MNDIFYAKFLVTMWALVYVNAAVQVDHVPQFYILRDPMKILTDHRRQLSPPLQLDQCVVGGCGMHLHAKDLLFIKAIEFLYLGVKKTRREHVLRTKAIFLLDTVILVVGIKVAPASLHQHLDPQHCNDIAGISDLSLYIINDPFICPDLHINATVCPANNISTLILPYYDSILIVIIPAFYTLCQVIHDLLIIFCRCFL